jgi:hypothetical protein
MGILEQQVTHFMAASGIDALNMEANIAFISNKQMIGNRRSYRAG